MGGDKPFDSPSARVRRPRELKKNVVEDNKAPRYIRKRRPAGKGGSQMKNGTEIGKDSTVNTAMISSLECKKLSGLRSRRSGLNHDEEGMNLEVDQKQQPNDSPIHEKEVSWMPRIEVPKKKKDAKD